MANACQLNRPVTAVPYTDAQAEAYAREVGAVPRPQETKNEIDERGAFIRQANSFIQPFGNGKDDLHAEANRFAVYWAHGCHWSNRPVIVRDILGLENVIGDVATTRSGETNVYGHGFADQPGHKDPICGAYFLSEFYKRANPDYTGRATTPTLVDVKEKKAVNNDYHRLTNYIEVQFRPFQPAAPASRRCGRATAVFPAPEARGRSRSATSAAPSAPSWSAARSRKSWSSTGTASSAGRDSGSPPRASRD